MRRELADAGIEAVIPAKRNRRAPMPRPGEYTLGCAHLINYR